MIARRSRGSAAALLALVLTAVALSGCGGGATTSNPSPSVSASPSTLKLTTYSNPRYGFTLRFDPRFKTGAGATARRVGQPPRFDIAFADSLGAKMGARYVDGLRVSVFELGRALTPRASRCGPPPSAPS